MNGSFQIAAIHLAVGNEYCRQRLCENYLLKIIVVYETQILPEIDCQVVIWSQYLDDINAYVGNVFTVGLIFRVFTRPRPKIATHLSLLSVSFGGNFLDMGEF